MWNIKKEVAFKCWGGEKYIRFPFIHTLNKIVTTLQIYRSILRSCQLSLSIFEYRNNVTFSIKAFRRLETFLFVRGFHADIAAIPMQGPALLSGDQLGDFHAGLVNWSATQHQIKLNFDIGKPKPKTWSFNIFGQNTPYI